MRRLVAILLGAVLVLSACSFDELADFVNTSGGSDNLTAPDQPKDVQAAGSTEVAKDSGEVATAEITVALDPNTDPATKVARANAAVLARPGDPRYLIYRAWFNRYNNDSGAALADINASRGLAEANFPDPAEAGRRWEEYFLDVTLSVMRSHSEGSDTYTYLFEGYCDTLRLYRNKYYDTLPGAAYVDFTSATEMCPPPGG